MIRVLSIIAALWASGAAAEDVTFIRQGGDTLELRQGEVFLELIYENSEGQNSSGGNGMLSLNGVQVFVRVTVAAHETLRIRVPDPGLFAEVDEVQVADGERVVVRIMPALF